MAGGLVVVRVRSTLLPLLLAILLVQSAQADIDPLTRKKAQTYINLGTELFMSGDHEGALAEFRRALKLHDIPEIRWNVARCLEELGRAEEALAAFESYLEVAEDPGSKKAVEEKISSLAPRVFGALEVECEPKGAKIEIRGLTEIPVSFSCPWKRERVKTGSYEVTAALSGHHDEVEEVEVAAGQTSKLLLKMEVEEKQPKDPGLEPPEVAVEQAADTSGPGAWPWVTAAASAAALAGGVYLWFRTSSDIEDHDADADEYDRATTPQEAERLGKKLDDSEASIERDRLATYVLLGAGVGLAVGSTLLFISGGSEGDSEVRIGAAAVQGGGLLTWEARW